jgi:hypothetical protein
LKLRIALKAGNRGGEGLMAEAARSGLKPMNVNFSPDINGQGLMAEAARSGLKPLNLNSQLRFFCRA